MARMRARGFWFAGAALLAAGALAAYSGARWVEGRVFRVLERPTTEHGLSVRNVRFSWFGPLRLEGVDVATTAGGRVTVDAVDVRWGLAGGRDPRSHVRGFTLRTARLEHGPLTVSWPEATLDVLSLDGGGEEGQLRLRQPASGGGIEAAWKTGPLEAREATLALSGLDLSAAKVSWGSEPILVPGVWSGRATFTGSGDRIDSEGSLDGRSVRLSLPRALAASEGDGVPTGVELAWNVRRDGARTEVRHAVARLRGLEVEGHGRLDQGPRTRQVEIELTAKSELGAAFQTTALQLPEPLRTLAGRPLGTAFLEASVMGPLEDAAALRIVPHLRFEPAPEAVEALLFLRRPFKYTPDTSNGVVLDVREGALDFVPIGQVPPLFLRTLLISEDAGFWGHPGIDVAEIPVAWAKNAERGESARGASTITQQLVKNLFLAKDKTYGRKVEEAALALVVDAAVPKARLLEIYLNVIEWGPDLYGLVPAARHYFGKSPSELTPKETAFLVCIIPSPVRYHQAHVAGHLGPGMEQLVENLLGKLRSVDALSEDEYEQAKGEELLFLPEGGAVAPPSP